MNGIGQRLMRAGNRLAVSLYRRSSGRIGGKAWGGTPVLLLTVPGRRTGVPRTTPVGYFTTDDGLVVAATAGGSARDPQWFRNLEVARHAQVELGARRIAVDVRVPDREERDRLWRDVVVAQAPSFARYEQKTARLIPVAVLRPS